MYYYEKDTFLGKNPNVVVVRCPMLIKPVKEKKKVLVKFLNIFKLIGFKNSGYKES